MNAHAPAPPPLPAHAATTAVEHLRFRTTRTDIFWSLNHRLLVGRGSMIVFLAIWAWSTFETAGTFIESDAGTPIKIAAVVVSAIFWAIFLLVLQVAVAACMTLFLRGDGLICEHTLRLLPDGLEEETAVNRTVQKYAVIDDMKKIWGHWVVRAAGGNAFVFRDAGVLEGDPADFAAKLNARV